MSTLMLKPYQKSILLILLGFLCTDTCEAQRVSKSNYLNYNLGFITEYQSSIDFQFSNHQSFHLLLGLKPKIGLNLGGFYHNTLSYPADSGMRNSSYNSQILTSTTESVLQVKLSKYGLSFGADYFSHFSRFYFFQGGLGIYSSMDRLQYKLFWEDLYSDGSNESIEQYQMELKSQNIIDLGVYLNLSLVRRIYRNYYLGISSQYFASFGGKRDIKFTDDQDYNRYQSLNLESRDINEMNGYFEKFRQQVFYNLATFNVCLTYQMGRGF